MNSQTNSNRNSVTTKLMLAVILMLSFVTFSSCGGDDDPELPTDSIVTLAQDQANLTSLVAALTKFPDLVTTLSGTGEFTVLAPSNAAFAALLTAIGQTSLDDIPEDVLKSVLRYHVIPGSVTSSQLTNGNVTTDLGEDIVVNITGGVTFNGSATVVTADVPAVNGVVHIIDQVLVQPSVTPIVGTIVAPAYFNKNFTTLIAAVQAASPNILTTLLNSDDKTLFAPTNDAFTAAGITALPNQATLDAVLTYHLINGSVVNAADITDGASKATTLNGDIFLSKGSAGVFINGTTQVTVPDIAGSNGVVHVINRTLMPPSQTIAEIAVAASEAPTPEFTQLVAALSKVPALLEAAGAEGELTVFAPTDAAFQALYTALNVADLDELETTIGNDKLAEVLQHHIVGATVFSTDLASGPVTTLNQDVTVDLTALTLSDANGSDPANLVATALNNHATNGVIHFIDKVLIPTGIL